MKTALLLIGLTTTGVVATDAQGTERDRATLVGLRGVGVQIHLSAFAPPGLTQDRLQTLVELRLRRSGVQVLSRDEVLSAPGFPDLELSVLVSESKLQSGTLVGYSYSFTLHLLQSVVLSRDSKITHVEGVTWQAPLSTGRGDQDRLLRFLMDDVESEVDRFINAYLAANPRNR